MKFETNLSTILNGSYENKYSHSARALIGVVLGLPLVISLNDAAHLPFWAKTVSGGLLMAEIMRNYLIPELKQLNKFDTKYDKLKTFDVEDTPFGTTITLSKEDYRIE
jgi:hypothetical protein